MGGSRSTTLVGCGDEDERHEGLTLDPISQGYALTGDQNIVHVEMVARYRVREPAEWAFYGPKAEDILRVEVTAAMVRSLGEMGVDRVLSDGRKDLVETAMRRAQAGLDAVHAGLELTSLELTRFAPPIVLARDFDAVQSAYHRRGNKQERGPGVRRKRYPAGPSRDGFAVADCPRGCGFRSRSAPRRCPGLSRTRPRIPRESCRYSREALQRCSRTCHRLGRQRTLGAAAVRRNLPRATHYADAGQCWSESAHKLGLLTSGCASGPFRSAPELRSRAPRTSGGATPGGDDDQ